MLPPHLQRFAQLLAEPAVTPEQAYLNRIVRHHFSRMVGLSMYSVESQAALENLLEQTPLERHEKVVRSIAAAVQGDLADSPLRWMRVHEGLFGDFEAAQGEAVTQERLAPILAAAQAIDQRDAAVPDLDRLAMYLADRARRGLSPQVFEVQSLVPIDGMEEEEGTDWVWFQSDGALLSKSRQTELEAQWIRGGDIPEDVERRRCIIMTKPLAAFFRWEDADALRNKASQQDSIEEVSIVCQPLSSNPGMKVLHDMLKVRGESLLSQWQQIVLRHASSGGPEAYDVRIRTSPHGLDVVVVEPGQDLDMAEKGSSMSLLLDFVHGVPCLHVHTCNDGASGVAQSLFAMPDGRLLIRPGDDDPRVEHVAQGFMPGADEHQGELATEGARP